MPTDDAGPQTGTGEPEQAEAPAGAPASRRRLPGRLTPAMLGGGVALFGLVAVSAAAILRAGAGVGTPGCHGTATLRVAAAPEIAGPVSAAARDYAAGRPGGRCVNVRVDAVDPVAAAARLRLPTGSGEGDDERPWDVWIPDSRLWVDRVRGSRGAPPMPAAASARSIASSPLVVAMPRAQAEATGWPRRQLGWADLLRFARDGVGWSSYGHPGWGPISVGWPEPADSTSGLLGVTAMAAVAGGGSPSSVSPQTARGTDARLAMMVFDHGVARYGATSADLLRGRPLSAVPSTEQAVLAYNRGRGDEGGAPTGGDELAAVYPREGTYAADYPYLVLAPGPAKDATGSRATTAERTRTAATGLLDSLTAPAGRRQLAAAGFRSPDATPGPAFPTTGAVLPTQARRPAVTPASSALTPVQATYTKLRQRGVMLAAFDVSGSMADPVPGTGVTKLQLAQSAAVRTVAMYSEDAVVGIWEFSTNLDGGRPYRQLLPLAPISGRRDAGALAVASMRPVADTGLYDTVIAAYDEVSRHYKPGVINTVVLLTDGRNDAPGSPTTLADATNHLSAAYDPRKPVTVVTIAYGQDADQAALRSISAATHGRSYSSRDPQDLVKILLDYLISS